LVTANRINISRIMREAGVPLSSETDYWWHIKDYPILRSSAVMYQAGEDAKNHGPAQGALTLANASRDFLSSLAGVGQAVKVPAKIMAEIDAAQSGRHPAFTGWDPWATGVPLSAYLTQQALNLVPGQRQANEILKWVDPTPRRITASTSLDYSPGVIEALEADGWTGLLSRVVGLGWDLPPQGDIDRTTGIVESPRENSLASRLAMLLGQNIKPIPAAEYEAALNQ